MVRRNVRGGGNLSTKFRAKRRQLLMEALETRQLLSAGDPVPTFGNNGATLVNYQGPRDSIAQSVTTDQQGRTIEAGITAETGAPSQIAVARYTSGGALDASFGVGGKTTIAAGDSGWANAVTTDSQNRVIIAGYEQPQYRVGLAPDQLLVIRLKADGTLDTSFNNSGIETLNFNGFYAYGNAVAVQADGKIVVAGQASPSATGSSSAAIARLNDDGSLDTSFGSAGTGEIITPVGSTTTSDIYGIALDSSRRIVVTGDAVSGHANTLVMRYNTDGSLDSTFGASGFVTVPVTNNQNYGYSIDFTSSGQIVVGGSGRTYNSATFTYPAGNDIAVLRLNTDGSLDSSFGSGGSESIDFNLKDQYPTAVRVLSNGDELVAGYQITSAGPVSMVVALTSSGAIDTTYNKTGLANTISGTFAGSIGSDGTVSLGGTPGSNGSSFAAGRITSAGALDTTFGSSGVVTTDFIGDLISDARAIALPGDGTTLIAGSATQNTGLVAAISRLKADGSLDASFGSGGTMITPLLPAVNAMVIQPDGKILLAGTVDNSTSTTTNYDMGVVRLNADGSIDTSFGTNGRVTIDQVLQYPYYQKTDDEASAIGLTSDGHIIVGGYTSQNVNGYNSVGLVRLTAAGAIDTSFGFSGRANPYFTNSVTPKSMVIDSAGRIIMSGYAIDANQKTQMFVARFTSGGADDASFGTKGFWMSSFSGGATADTVALQADGSIVIGGQVTISGSNAFAVARFTSGGSLDANFNTSGYSINTAIPFAVGSVVPTSDGGVLAGGGGGKIYLAKFTSTGAPDPSFGISGVASSNIGLGSISQFPAPPVIALRSNGYIVAAATGSASIGSGFVAFGALFENNSNPALGQIRGTVFQDSNGSGSPSSPVVGAAGVTVYLDLNNDATLDSNDPRVVTTSTGQFSFSGLVPGTYTVREAYPSTYYETVRPFITVTVSPSQPTPYIYFGVSPYSTLSGTVYNDLLGYGFQTGNPGSPNVTVYLDVNQDGVFDAGDLSTVTDSNGNFTLSNAPAGTFTLREIVPAGTVVTQPQYVGSPGYYNVTLNGLIPTSKLFGNFTPGTAGGTVFSDLNNNGTQDPGEPGIAGVTVFADLNGTGVLSGNDPSAITDSNGNYQITGLDPGVDIFQAVAPAGDIVETAPLSQRIHSGGNIAYAVAIQIPVVTASVSGKEYEDLNGTGVYGPGDVTVAGLQMYIDSNNNGKLDSGEPVASTTLQGDYTFTNLQPGTYVLLPVLIPGWYQTQPTGGLPRTVTLFSGQVLTGQDFGQGAPRVGTISGTVFSDSNSNGTLDNGEPGLTNVAVYIDLNSNGINDTGEPQTVTNASGSFLFNNVSAGTYQLREVVPSGFTVKSPASGYDLVTVVAQLPSTGVNFADIAIVVAPTKLIGTVIGTTGSYKNSGNTASKAFDGNLSTYFDGPNASGNWVGLDLGSAKVITSLAYASRSGWASRMNGGIFQASNSSTFSSGVVNLYTIASNANPSSTALTIQTVTNPGSYRYVRYYAPANSYGDVAEVQFFGHAPVITTDVISGTVTGVPSGTTIYLDANGNSTLDSGELSTTTTGSGNYSFSNVPAGTYVVRQAVPAGYLQTAPIGGSGYPITVANGSSFSGLNFTDTHPALTKFTGTTIGTSGSYGNSGNTIAKATDGNLSTYFDGPTANGDYVGLDLGSAKVIKQISYAPRTGWASRMVGGIFQASNSANFSSGVVNLYTITTSPMQNVLTNVTINVTTAYRYVRYLSPSGSYGDVAEISFYG